MGREQVLRKLEKSWTEFKESYAGLTEEQMNMPGVIEEWSVKDIIAHVSVWEKETLKMLPLILNGSRTPRYSTTYGGIDAFNALKTEEQRSLSCARCRRIWKDPRKPDRYLQTCPSRPFRESHPAPPEAGHLRATHSHPAIRQRSRNGL